MKVIPSARKAQLVDYILLGWQTSTYTLRNSDRKWFMKPYAEIVEDTGIPKSTLERYIKELVEEGFIERRQALYSRTKEQGGFEVKKGNYIHITDKLLALIKPSKPVPEAPPAAATDIHNDSKDPYQEDNQEQDNKEPECKEVDINEGIDPLKMRGLYIRDLYPSFLINNIIFKKLTRSVDKTTLQRLTQQFDAIQNLLYSEIKEEIPDEVKKLILGTFFNLTFQHKKQFSSPAQLTAEYIFALLNIEFYFPDVTCFKHRNNILAKMIRTNQWKTPKGFYKHFYLGQDFKDQQELREKRWKKQKNNEMNPNHEQVEEQQQDEQLIQLEAQMLEKSTQLDALMQSIYEQSSEEVINTIRERIQDVRRELEHLWYQQSLIEQQCQQELLNDQKQCA
ncbi:helix-turn-helix domain-containing protein [Legionella sp. PATHC038]|uniref:helix-turn-helix domain-containing protein n=1 Tax=Legionella sheltonii TaxID=2992041 RepID=UPI0022435F3F|nr:helix-turn-helix domain-containing protein [Legionella sp. PATHC038]MCW8399511.1 helix-turn-helix domain-containing protein [Legionella sp. PATHC038]MDX1791235.1 helix-turn-helix domain-containing protein [Legionella pneumophila]MDX1850380.1 helix-turn-helix domain-containing protein [Legionella pneumophila]